ncbi:hypothetical protein SeMB42_g01345 [Synchytrium endobioticum]|uniref:Homeobox domain-containing protein n=1 Tax=Synchytrium endobioticum TaxID=286115 RepID=A0A507DLM7_9FUNG|nr:hypothetical protein SeMB42_g01345 [Synchytrium endobioticum]
MAVKRSYDVEPVRETGGNSSIVAGCSVDGAPLRDGSLNGNVTKKRTRIDAKDTQRLMEEFRKQPKPTTHARNALADKMGIPRQVLLIWFQNRRAKVRREARAKELVGETGKNHNYNLGNRARLVTRPHPHPYPRVRIPSSSYSSQFVAPVTAMAYVPDRPIYQSDLDADSIPWYSTTLAPNLSIPTTFAGAHAQPVPPTVPPSSYLTSLNEWNFAHYPHMAYFPPMSSIAPMLASESPFLDERCILDIRKWMSPPISPADTLHKNTSWLVDNNHVPSQFQHKEPRR